MTITRANQLNGSDWLKNSFSIWRGLHKDSNSSDHPAPFPIALATRLIDCYAANLEGTVLDPFAGSGTTLLAGLRTGMHAVGFDINPEYRRMFEKRLALLGDHKNNWRYEIQDARTLGDVLNDHSIEISITSPPYWDILNRRRTADSKNSRPYSGNRHDLGNLDNYGIFLDALRVVAGQVGKVLRPRGYFILNVMDIRKGSIFYPLHQDATNAILQCGCYTLDDIIIWDRQTEYNSMRPLGYPRKFIINKVHEYLLIFRNTGE